ncbi:MAG: WGR domain-containing protein [Planctomycetales bacterium]|nr:WGR domain-containing protein [Planctomycetales bacterium]
MDNILSLALEAHSDEHNHHRRYEIIVGRDLLNFWTVSISYGRVGHRGQEKRFASRSADDIKTIIRHRLQRRLSAPNRIGCAYRLVSFDNASGFETPAWLPSDLMAKLFASPYSH